MEGPLSRLLISSRFINKHGRHRQFLFLIVRFPCLLTDREEMSNLYKGPSIDASYQVSDHLDKRFQRRRFLEIDQSESKYRRM
jgi:hypothetical protein